MQTSSPHASPRGYELKTVTLLTLGLGMVGLDRFIINPLFPVMQQSLGLDYRDLGLISAVLALAWGLSSIVSGRLTDRVGFKVVLIPAMTVFSLLTCLTGLAGGLGSLLVIRAVMGLAEGAYLPASIVATIDASKPSRVGLNIGLQQMAQPAIGLGLGPLIAIGLLHMLPSWHYVFAVAALPGLVLAFLLARVVRPGPLAATTRAHEGGPGWRAAATHRVVIVNTACMACYLTCLITLSTFMPSYLTDQLNLGLDTMGFVLAGQGVGSLIGTVAVPALSDRIGRKPAILGALAIELVALWFLPSAGREPVVLFALLFLIIFMNAGVLAVTVGPLTNDGVPPAIAASAIGIVVGVGEIVGGALAPAVAGMLAHAIGIAVIPRIALGAITIGTLIVAFGVLEPARATAAPPSLH
ncbi:MFS transporter [Pandoraea bronchicola]|uniref:Major facilitator transporter n=1 Tax=Pandoraea bronchicola TaxID=2508287 RepID=A0A5E5BZV3_9BURK|nr:MFS transporter [Pandoraea bronchicola]VVE90485.1 major facilitator transporter [Pandoraea bronchicola]